ncbi:MAG TPA: protoporphyrinogen oxidase [Deferrisomatales bacterium]|nr:protoporphyrinogen oxidase [Deferrisomatales bacterium]
MAKVVVIGGGLSGLAAARAVLDEARNRGVAVQVRLLERDAVLGGKIRTSREDGFVCEEGPNGFLDNKPATLALVERLEAGPRLLKSEDGARRRYVFTGGELKPLPEDPMSFVLSDILSIRGKLRLAAEMFLPQGQAGVDESVAQFVRRRLGDEALDKLIDPMSAGIYAGDPAVMSLASCFPKVTMLEQQFGGLLKGMLAMQKMAKAAGREGPQSAGPGGVLWSMRSGTAELIDLLAASLPEGTVQAGMEAEELERSGASWRVRTADGGELEADAVALATPAYDAARLLRGRDERLGELLYAVPYVPAAVVCVGYVADQLTRPLDGFGFLIPRSEGRRILGSLWSSSIFANRAPSGRVLLTQIVGGARNPELVDLDDGELLQLVRDELSWTLGIRAEPCYTKVVRWARAIPQYVVGHGQRLAEIQERVGRLGGLFLGGNAYHGISINDCTHHAPILAGQVLDGLQGAMQ